MADEKIGWGIIGCGAIGPLHADAVQANKQAELVQVYDIVEENARKLAEERACSYVTSIEELLSNDDIQAVSILYAQRDALRAGHRRRPGRQAYPVREATGYHPRED